MMSSPNIEDGDCIERSICGKKSLAIAWTELAQWDNCPPESFCGSDRFAKA